MVHFPVIVPLLQNRLTIDFPEYSIANDTDYRLRKTISRCTQKVLAIQKTDRELLIYILAAVAALDQVFDGQQQMHVCPYRNIALSQIPV